MGSSQILCNAMAQHLINEQQWKIVNKKNINHWIAFVFCSFKFDARSMSLQATNRKSVDVQPQKRISSLQNRINWNLKRLMVTQYQRPSTLAFPKSRNCQSFLEFEYQKKTRDFELQKRNLDFEIAEVPSFSLPKNPRGKTYQAGTKHRPVHQHTAKGQTFWDAT